MNFQHLSVRPHVPAIWVLVIMTSIGPFGDTEYTPSLPAIAQDLHVSYGATQQSMTIYLFAYALMQLIYGPLSDKIGRKPIALWGALLFVIGSYVCWISGTLDMLLFGRFLQGLGSCAGAIISSAAVRDSYPKKSIAITYAKINGAFALAPALGPIIGAIVDDFFGWHTNMLILLSAGLFLLIVVFFFFAETHPAVQDQSTAFTNIWHTYTLLFRQPDFLPAILINATAIGVVYTSLTEGPALVTDTLGLSSRWIAVVALCVLTAFTLGSIACIKLGKKISSKQIIPIGLVLIFSGGVFLTAAGYFHNISLLTTLLPIMLSFSGIALIVPSALAIAMRPFEQVAGAASAMTGFSQMSIAALANAGISLLPTGPVYSLAITFMILALLGALPYRLSLKTRQI